MHKLPPDYNETVQEVKQWNEALRSPETGTLRGPPKSSMSHPLKRDAPLRNIQNEKKVLGKSPIKNTKSKSNADVFKSPEHAGT